MRVRPQQGFHLLACSVLGIAIALTACSGGSQAVPRTGGGGGVTTQAITFVVQIPARTTAATVRRPRYVSPSTRWITASVAPAGGAPVTAGNACDPTQCSITIAAPVGADTFTISLYDAQNGNLLSSGQTTQTIVQGQTSTVNVVFGGAVASLQIAPATIRFTSGVASTASVTISELDADGNTIVSPPSTYPAPITLTSSDTTGSVTVTPGTVTGPQQAVTVAYNGTAPGPSSVTISARTGTVSAATSTVTFGTQRLYESRSTMAGITATAIGGGGTLGASFSFGGSQVFGALAVAPDGTLDASASSNFGPAAVDVFPSPAPAATAARYFNAAGTSSLAVDGAGDVYTEAGLGVYVYPPNAASTGGNTLVAPLRTVATFDTTLALGQTGALYALAAHSSASAVSKIDVFAPNASAVALPVRSIYSASGTYFEGLAVDTADNVYVRANAGGVEVMIEYAAGASGTAQPVRTVTGGLSSSDFAIAVDAAGYVYTVASDETIVVIPPASGGTATTARARGAAPASGTRRPAIGTPVFTHLAVDRGVAPAPPTGNPAPFATFAQFSAGANFFGGIASGSDGRIWVTSPTTDEVLAVTTGASPGGAGVVTTYAIPRPATAVLATPLEITAGPDGALWFVEDNGDAIGRITTAGATTLYPLVASGRRYPHIIIVGPDGNLWFTESGNGTQPASVARITTAGVITEFPLAANVVARSLAPGPDGNVYAVERVSGGNSSLVRITPAGAMTTVASNVPYGDLALGADGNFYITDPVNTVVQRVSPSGAATTVPVFAPTVQGIVSGPNGRLYVGGAPTACGLSIIGTDGTNVVNFPLTSAYSGVQGIVTGPDGNVWVATGAGLFEVTLH